MAKQKVKQTEKGRNLSLIFYIITGITAFIVYANSLGNDFVFDDESVVLGDPTITTISNIPKYFTGDQGFHKVIGRYYRPVVSTSYAIDYYIWKYNAFGFHFTNVLIHVINSLLFLKLLLLIFKPAQQASQKKNVINQYTILFGALIFAIHPIHTEAVAWVSGRTDSLSCTFFFAAFIFYIRYSENHAGKNLVLLLLFYLFSLLAKEMAITLPVLNIVPTMNFMADRFLYIPSVVVSFVFIGIVMKYYTERNINTIYTFAVILILAYSFLTVTRNSDWKDNDTLFFSAENRPGTVTYVNIGNIYANKQQYDKAETYYRK